MGRRFIEDNQRFLLEEDDIDAIRVFLVYLLMKSTDLGIEDIYNFIFGEGKKILWN